jgi:SulP family sulfate permease
MVALERSGLLARIGEANVHLHIDDALDRAREILGLPPGVRPAGAVANVARDPRAGGPDCPSSPPTP